MDDQVAARALSIQRCSPASGLCFCNRAEPSLPLGLIDLGLVVVPAAGYVVDLLTLAVDVPLDVAVA
jgi:hypothetical protein